MKTSFIPTASSGPPPTVYPITASGGTSAGLGIFDLSNPTNPVPVAFYETRADVNGLAVVGGYAYLGSGGSLEVIDISNPANPRLAGRYDGGYGILSLVLVGNHAYLAGGVLQIVDVSDPANPHLVGTYGSGKNVFGVSVLNNYAYLANNSGTTDPANPGFEVLDISNPAAPQRVGGYGIHLPTHVFAFGNYAYVGSGSGELHVVDISNPATAQRLGSTDGLGEIASIFVSGNYAYLADQPRWDGTGSVGGGLQVIDVSNPASPQLAGSWVGNYFFPPPFYDVFVSGGFAYVAAENSGFMVFDVRNPANPRLHGFYEINNSFGGGEDARSVLVLGNYAYVMDRLFGLYVLDVSDPAQPRRVGGNRLIGDFSAFGATDITAAGGKLYALAGERGLIILDLFRDPNALRLETLTPLTPGSFRFLLHGPPGMSGQIQSSSNLQNWTDWMPFSLGAPSFELIDSTIGSGASRYYRAVAP